MLRAVWGGFTTALASRDTAQALQYFNFQGQTKYGSVLTTLLPQMPSIAASFSPLQSMTLGVGIGEYAVNRLVDGVNQIFLIYFVRGVDGVWRLDSM